MGPPPRDDILSRITALEVHNVHQQRQHEENQRALNAINEKLEQSLVPVNEKLDLLMKQNWLQRGAYLMSVGMAGVLGYVGHLLFEKFK